jgi:hypothetical protein
MVGEIWRTSALGQGSGQVATRGSNSLYQHESPTMIESLSLNKNVDDIHRSHDNGITFHSGQTEDIIPSIGHPVTLLPSSPGNVFHQPSESSTNESNHSCYPVYEPTITNFVSEKAVVRLPDNLTQHSNAQQSTPEEILGTYLPFKIQHGLLGSIQALIEETCFYFAEKWLPEVLTRQGWSTPEQGELTAWWPLLSKCHIPPQAVAFGPERAATLFRYCRQIRNCAVHRALVSITGIKLMIQDAMQLIRGFKDILRAAKLRKLQDCLERRDLIALQRNINEPLGNFKTQQDAPAAKGNRRQGGGKTEVSIPLPRIQMRDQKGAGFRPHIAVKYFSQLAGQDQSRRC